MLATGKKRLTNDLERLNLRAILHPDGADLFETLLAKVTALRKQIHPAPLEVLIFIQVQLNKIT